MLLRFYRWIDARWPLSGALRLGREEEIPGGASFSYALGSATLFVFLLQVATGIAQLFYYAPTVDHAYDSLNYLRTEVPSAGPKPDVRMPAFGDAKTLTQQEIANVEANVLQLNGVDRARLGHAGLAPRQFFYGVLTTVTLTGFGLASFCLYLRRSKGRIGRGHRPPS